jgi:hypothetical protein
VADVQFRHIKLLILAVCLYQAACELLLVLIEEVHYMSEKGKQHIQDRLCFGMHINPVDAITNTCMYRARKFFCNVLLPQFSLDVDISLHVNNILDIGSVLACNKPQLACLTGSAMAQKVGEWRYEADDRSSWHGAEEEHTVDTCKGRLVVDMLSTQKEQERIRRGDVILDVGLTAKPVARGLHVAEGEKAMGIRPHMLDQELRRVPIGLSAVLLPHRKWEADLDTRVSKSWQELASHDSALVEFGMKQVEPSTLTPCALDTQKRRIIANGLATPSVDNIFRTCGIGGEHHLQVWWLQKGLSKYSVPQDLQLVVLRLAFPIAKAWSLLPCCRVGGDVCAAVSATIQHELQEQEMQQMPTTVYAPQC